MYLKMRSTHEGPKVISQRLRSAAKLENKRLYAKDVSLLYISEFDFMSRYIFTGSAISPNSIEFIFLLENISPKLFVLEYSSASSDKSWKLDAAKTNNIRKFKSLLEYMSNKGIPMLGIVRDSHYDIAIESGLLEEFDLVLIPDENSVDRSNFQSLDNLDYSDLDEAISVFIRNNLRSLQNYV